MRMFIAKNSVVVAGDYTSVLIKKAIIGAAGQNQVYDVLRHSMCQHREKLSSLDTTGFSIAISLSLVGIIIQQRFGFKASIVLTIVLIALTIVYAVCYSYSSLAHLCPRLSEDGFMWSPVRAIENR